MRGAKGGGGKGWDHGGLQDQHQTAGYFGANLICESNTVSLEMLRSGTVGKHPLSLTNSMDVKTRALHMLCPDHMGVSFNRNGPKCSPKTTSRHFLRDF